MYQDDCCSYCYHSLGPILSVFPASGARIPNMTPLSPLAAFTILDHIGTHQCGTHISNMTPLSPQHFYNIRPCQNTAFTILEHIRTQKYGAHICRAEPALRVGLESLNKVPDGPNSRMESSTTKNPALDHLSFEMRRFIASYAANVVFVSKPVEYYMKLDF